MRRAYADAEVTSTRWGEAADEPPGLHGSRLAAAREYARPTGYGFMKVLSTWYASSVSRIRKAYEAKFRAALRRFGARQADKGINLLLKRAVRLTAARALPLNDALAHVDAQLQARLTRSGRRANGPNPGAPRGVPPLFVCDAGLGGLARWLRAAGYDALWHPKVSDAALLREARERRAVLLTTDSLLLERRVVRDGVIPTVWLPPTLHAPDQLALVLRELRLTPLPPRCMSCGGELRAVDKTAVADRIPPRTARWLDEYFVCARCDRLFWRGTHWQRITARLGQLGVEPRGAS